MGKIRFEDVEVGVRESLSRERYINKHRARLRSEDEDGKKKKKEEDESDEFREDDIVLTHQVEQSDEEEQLKNSLKILDTTEGKLLEVKKMLLKDEINTEHGASRVLKILKESKQNIEVDEDEAILEAEEFEMEEYIESVCHIISESLKED